ncbi:alpha/beta hydrolase [Rhizobium grahamii]|uniref:Alpha/beta hydrolase n=1 Tax=Rhizobium grahamii TaxID=1120045 RepID=A0A5Q0C696_9HYPH|nr:MULTISPECIES: alpha/beta hydrolase [Rhizobium]QFY59567.1 alpha/beta hydrolase [Rhizobium grahamii]QRM47910.1 alpha/beta hydrolase [Rhizobium sp. BG6]
MEDVANAGFVQLQVSAEDGLALSLRDYPARPDGNPQSVPIVCLPGLTRNARDFHQLALALSQDRLAAHRVIAVDYRGRGLSAWDANKANYSIAVEARDVLTVCDHLGIERAIFIGTSRGGLILHIFAAMRPALLAGVVLNDIGPVIEATGLMRIRDYLNRGGSPADWNEAVAALQANHGRYFPALNPEDWREMADAIYRVIDDRIVPDVDPAIAEALLTIDFNKPLPDLWQQFDAFQQIPLLVIRGEHSDLLSEKTVEEMRARNPGITTRVAEGQGHAPLLHLAPAYSELSRFLASR